MTWVCCESAVFITKHSVEHERFTLQGCAGHRIFTENMVTFGSSLSPSRRRNRVVLAIAIERTGPVYPWIITGRKVSIAEALHGAKIQFGRVFRDWTLTNQRQKPISVGLLFAYSSIYLIVISVTPAPIFTKISLRRKASRWAARWLNGKGSADVGPGSVCSSIASKPARVSMPTPPSGRVTVQGPAKCCVCS